ncbi:MAG TPA: hypothetical protein VFO67_14650 [Gemmatimonadales bacterium]|nr:hypothetical protein [Gemmatimonadales bacterium]
MAAKYILAALSVLFIVLGLRRMSRGGGAAHLQSRTWLLIGIIFGVVSAWLFTQ